MSAATVWPERQRLMDELRELVRSGQVERGSAEWSRLRERARASDPEWRERKAAENRRRYHEKRAKRDAAASLTLRRRIADRPSVRSQLAERRAARAERKRMSRPSTETKLVKLRKHEIERIDAVIGEIKAAEGSACTATTWRDGFRVPCMLRGEHQRHVSTRGDSW